MDWFDPAVWGEPSDEENGTTLPAGAGETEEIDEWDQGSLQLTPDEMEAYWDSFVA